MRRDRGARQPGERNRERHGTRHPAPRLFPHRGPGRGNLRGRPGGARAPALAGSPRACRRRRPRGRVPLRGPRRLRRAATTPAASRPSSASGSPPRRRPTGTARSTSRCAFRRPPDVVEIVLQRRQPDQTFATVWRTTVDPDDVFVERAAPPRQELIAIERNGEPADKVDLLLLGDGYTAADCTVRFAVDARRLADALFRHEPFAARRGDFNVWGLCPPAAESGIARPSSGIHRRTPVGATYDAFGSERYVLTFDNRALRDVAAWAPYEFVAMLVNSETYGGGGIFGTFATVAVDSDWAEYVFVHEFGHHFAGLADEYYTSPVAYEPAGQVVEPWEANVTALLEGQPLKWRDLVDPATPVPTPWPKDAFEARQREFQARRKQLRAERRPEWEMNALFREEQRRRHATVPRGGSRRRGRRLPGRQLRCACLLPTAARLRDVHPQRGTVLPGLPAGARADHRPVRGTAAHRRRLTYHAPRRGPRGRLEFRHRAADRRAARHRARASPARARRADHRRPAHLHPVRTDRRARRLAHARAGHRHGSSPRRWSRRWRRCWRAT